jgi:hypothetical protein
MAESKTSSNTALSQLEHGVLKERKQETNIVDWDGDCDPANPKNWSQHKKWAHIAILSILSLITYV